MSRRRLPALGCAVLMMAGCSSEEPSPASPVSAAPIETSASPVIAMGAPVRLERDASGLFAGAVPIVPGAAGVAVTGTRVRVSFEFVSANLLPESVACAVCEAAKRAGDGWWRDVPAAPGSSHTVMLARSPAMGFAPERTGVFTLAGAAPDFPVTFELTPGTPEPDGAVNLTIARRCDGTGECKTEPAELRLSPGGTGLLPLPRASLSGALAGRNPYILRVVSGDDFSVSFVRVKLLPREEEK